MRCLELELALRNNGCENSIRPFVIGRRHWLFAATVAGASASANLVSLLETCKINGIVSYQYLRSRLVVLPRTRTGEDLEAMLPRQLAHSSTALWFGAPCASVQISRRAAALLELLGAPAGARIIASNLGLQRLGGVPLVDCKPKRQPVFMHVQNSLRNLLRQL